MRSVRVIVLVVVITLPHTWAEAQSFYAIRRNRNLLLGVGSGTANYLGEMVNPGEFGTLKPNFTLSAEYYWTDRISTRAQLTWFQISGDDSKADDDRPGAKPFLHTRVTIELSAIGVINLTPLGPCSISVPHINLHAFLGIGLLRFNPKPKITTVKKWHCNHYKRKVLNIARIQPVIPMGLGARIKLDPFFNIIAGGWIPRNVHGLSR